MRSVILAAALSLATAAFGHHGWGEYDGSTTLKLAGTVVESGYHHPHGHILVEVDGKTWHVVLAPPSRMERRGLSRKTLEPGAKVTVEGYAHRSKPEELRAERIHVQGITVELR